ncbi:MAG: iron-containing redox enzyme family protein [Burkholderiales bacterium]|nr:iron-containing redox enzyme family protein [Burkholderiales bacterium]
MTHCPIFQAAEAVCKPASARSDAAARFRHLARTHPLWRHPFVERCRAGELTLPQVRVLASQMYRFCHEFPCFLATALAASRDEATRMVIAENLWEELGEGDPQRAHATLFRRFTRALGISDEELADSPVLPETRALIDAYLALGDRACGLGLVGALCHASEGIVASLYTQIQAGLMSALHFDKEALVFFELHIHVDDGHADHLESVLLPMLRTPQDEDLVAQAIGAALDARCRFFDGVLRASCTADMGLSLSLGSDTSALATGT